MVKTEHAASVFLLHIPFSQLACIVVLFFESGQLVKPKANLHLCGQ